MDHLLEKTIKREVLFEGKVIDLHIEEVELPNGHTSRRELIKHSGAVAILALTDENKIVMVQQYRKALDKVIVEIPAGKLEKGEAPEVTAKRELEEETGYDCETLTPLISFYTSPGFADELVHLFIAKDLKKIENPASLDEDEFVDLLEVSLDEALELLKEKKIYDAKTAYAVQYLQLQQAIGE
ncbi:NUDIX hydrolase [Fredinandcohnia onubensis]|uniref:NUDIX hydrolase n=1 Tax=Fredinandcohnia onubensis TaxID=1571209 RepID=UPI000C0BDFD6|nr:NUDIX hydrolase [Fredinandcohnia onubensis]